MSEFAIRRRKPAVFAVVAAVILGLAAAVIVPVTAAAAPVALTGTVVLPSGSPAASVTVTALYDIPGHTVAATTKTSSSGSFTFPALAPADYTLKFSKTSTSFAQYLGGESDVDDAQIITLTDAGGNKRYIKVGLVPGGTISGTVKKASGSAIAGYTVKAYAGSTVVATTKTSTSGKYSLTGLEPGKYVLQASASTGTPAYATTYSGGVGSLADANPLRVQAKLTTSYNFVLGSTAKVSGVVQGIYGASVFENLANVTVTPYRSNASGDLEALPGLARKTGSSGAFTLSGLPAGEYSLRFDPPREAPLPPSGVVYGATFLGGWAGSEYATRFTIAAGATVTGKDIVLDAGHSISGKLTQGIAPGGPAIIGSLVSLYPVKTLVGPDYSVTPQRTHTDSQGRYEFVGLRPDIYLVVTGSFSDADPDDGWDDNVVWSRRVKNVDVSAGSQSGQDIWSIVRQTTAPISGGAPVVSAPDGLQVGDTLTVSSGTWVAGGDYPPTFDYQWISGDNEIEGATGSTYQLTPGDVETTVQVRVTAHDFGWGDGHTTVSAPGATQLGGALNAIQPPALSGEAIVGNTVSIDTGVWYGPNWGTVDPEFEITWLAGPDAGSLVPIGSGPTHRIDGDDFEEGGKLGWTVQASRSGFADSSEWAGTATMYEGEFEATTAPKVTKTTTAFKVSTGTWTPTPESFEYEWVIHNADGSVLEEVDGTTTLPLTSARKGKYISVTVIPVASHVGGAPAELVAQKASKYAATGSSTMSGDIRVGEEVGAPDAGWTPTPTSIAYKWQYLSGTTWKSIPGATSADYTIPTNYLGRKLRVVQTASKTGYPTTSKTSNAATVGLGFAPGNTVAPSTPTTPKVGVALTVNSGTWSPTPTGYAYQWKYATTTGGAGPFTKIAGATSATFTPPTSLAGKVLYVDVTTKRTGYASATETAEAGTVSVGILTNLTPPKAILASPTDSIYSATSPGTWSPTPDSVEYRWFRRIDIGLIPLTPENENRPDHIDDTDYQLVLQATAKKAGWADGVTTTIVRKGVIGVNGVNALAPFDGPFADRAFTALVSDTHFPPTPQLTSVKLQWQYEKSPGVWANIAGATGTTFTPRGATYLNKALRYQIKRTAPGYFDLTEYSATQTVQLAPPVTPSPSLSYDAASVGVSDAIGLAPVTWSSPVTLSYRWDISDSDTGPWTTIATTPSYTPKPGDFDRWIRLEVRASRPGYTTQELQLSALQVGYGQLDPVTAPKIVKSGNVLSHTAGTWDAPGVTFGRQWIQFELNGSSSTIGTGPTLTLTSAMAGKKILLVLNAYAGASHVDSWSTTLVAQTGNKPVALFPPQIMNDVQVGNTIWVDVPWDNGDLVQTYQWYRNGVAISGATDLQYTVPAGDLGTTLSVKVKASAFGYASNTITVNAGAVRTDDPILNTAAPTLVLARGAGSTGRVGEAISVNPGTWNLPGVVFAYQWRTSEGAIPGATSSSYVPRAADIGREVWVTVTASKPFYLYTTSADSPRSVIDWGKVPQPIGSLPIAYNPTTHVLASTAPVVFDLPATLTYQWQWFDDAGPVHSYVNIAGANSASYTVPSGSPAREYRLTVVPTLAGHGTDTFASTGLNVPAIP